MAVIGAGLVAAGAATLTVGFGLFVAGVELIAGAYVVAYLRARKP